MLKQVSQKRDWRLPGGGSCLQFVGISVSVKRSKTWSACMIGKAVNKGETEFRGVELELKESV